MNWFVILKTAMPLDPNAHRMYGPGQTHRLPAHSGFDQVLDPSSGRVRSVPSRRTVTPEQQRIQDELYSGTHASMSQEVAAIYANNNSTPQDPPVIIAFTSQEQWRTDADTTGPEPTEMLSMVTNECPEAEEIAQQPFDEQAVTDLMENLEQSHDFFGDEGDGNHPDLLEDIHRSHRADTVDQVPKFYKHYYGDNAAQMFYEDFLVPLFSGKGYDPRIQAYMTNQMRFMQPIPDTQIVSVGTTERFSQDYADDDDTIDPDEWDEDDGELPELDEDNRRMYTEDGRRNIYYHGDPFDPHVHWVWHNPQITQNVKTYYHGTTKSRALRALPELAQYINQIGA